MPVPAHPQAQPPPDHEWARACCGPAHGHTWRRDEPSAWPGLVVLESASGPQAYRLVHDLRAHRPARDDLGNTLYMPVPDRSASPWGRTR